MSYLAKSMASFYCKVVHFKLTHPYRNGIINTILGKLCLAQAFVIRASGNGAGHNSISTRREAELCT